MHPWRGRSRPAQAVLPVDDPEAVIGERHPQMVACETFLGHPVRRFDGVGRQAETALDSVTWARAWSDHVRGLDRIADRLPQGEPYLEDGLIWHLEVDRGEVRGIVLGSQLYAQRIQIEPITREEEAELIEICRDRVETSADLLAGRAPAAVIEALASSDRGLMPAAEDFTFACTCPDGRGSKPCRHAAALVLGLGTRLAQRPKALFNLRGTDPEVIKGLLPPALSRLPPPAAKLIPADEIAEIFDLRLHVPPPPEEPSVVTARSDDDPLGIFLASKEAPEGPEASIESEPRLVPANSESSTSWLDEDWDDDDDDPDVPAASTAANAPTPRDAAAETEEAEEILEIGRADLLELGLASHRIQRWLVDGTLLRTEKRGQYQLTPEAWAELEPLLGSD